MLLERTVLPGWVKSDTNKKRSGRAKDCRGMVRPQVEKSKAERNSSICINPKARSAKPNQAGFFSNISKLKYENFSTEGKGPMQANPFRNNDKSICARSRMKSEKLVLVKAETGKGRPNLDMDFRVDKNPG